MKKILFYLIYFSFLLPLYSQYEQKFSYEELYNGVELYNGIRTVGDPEKGIIFINKEGKQYSKDVHRMRWGIIYSNNGILPFIEVVKELENIDETFLDKYFTDTNGQKEYEVDGLDFINDFLDTRLLTITRKGEKYAYITKFGELVTDFKYSKDKKGIYRIDTLKNIKLYVDVNALGKEIYAGEMAISYSLNENIYKVYDEKEQYYLHYDGFNYPFDTNTPLRRAVNDGYILLGCNTLAYGHDIYRLNKGKIKHIKLKRYIVRSNFYKNRAIAAKSKKNLPNEANLFIINEKGKIIKSISEEYIRCGDFLDKFGAIEIYSEKGKALIDYNGNFIIPYCESCDIHYSSDGLYKIYYHNGSISINEEMSGLYNQYGHKILPSNLIDLDFLEGVDYNYFIGERSIYTLDKDNNILKIEKL